MNKTLSTLAVLLISFASSASFGAEKPTSLTLELAQSIAKKATAYAKEKTWKVSIAIANSEGNLLYFQRDEEAYKGSIDAAIAKAKSANDFKRSTTYFAEQVKTGRIGLITVPGIVAIEGAIPIVLGGKHAGAIGVSGARSIEDEEVATAALK